MMKLLRKTLLALLLAGLMLAAGAALDTATLEAMGGRALVLTAGLVLLAVVVLATCWLWRGSAAERGGK